ncbi:MAG: DoxX family protein [Anaerolineales bacterium]|uniref:DoxX family protein n=1 Tax=Candidatus Villigracilis proximus TaxID=3140683 RepID=UPI0031370EB9|nr:DoxX family protein [Anaerolineales bacterium]
MNIALWIAQILLAGMYGMAGSMKTMQIAKVREMMPWSKGRSDNYVRFVGTSELLGALGMILPVLTGILAWLTPVAALGLSIIQLLAIFQEHLPKKEYNVIPMNIVLLALSVFVAIGRWYLFTN